MVKAVEGRETAVAGMVKAKEQRVMVAERRVVEGAMAKAVAERVMVAERVTKEMVRAATVHL